MAARRYDGPGEQKPLSHWDDRGTYHLNPNLDRDEFGNPLFTFNMGEARQPGLDMPGDAMEKPGTRRGPLMAVQPAGLASLAAGPMPEGSHQTVPAWAEDVPAAEPRRESTRVVIKPMPPLSGQTEAGRPGVKRRGGFDPSEAGGLPTRSVTTPASMGKPEDAKPASFMTLWKMAKVDDLATKIKQDAAERFPGIPEAQAMKNYGLLPNGDLVYYDKRTDKLYPVGPQGIWGDAQKIFAGILGQTSPIGGAVMGGAAGFLLGGPVGAVIGAGAGGGAGGWARKAEGTLLYNEPNTAYDYWDATLTEAFHAALGEKTLQTLSPVARAMARRAVKLGNRGAGLGGLGSGGFRGALKGRSVASNVTMPEIIKGIPKSIASDIRNLSAFEDE